MVNELELLVTLTGGDIAHNIHAHTHTHTHTHAHTRTHININTHKHAHTYTGGPAESHILSRWLQLHGRVPRDFRPAG
jgi:hypothetical protein